MPLISERILIIVPAYNEERTVGGVVKGLREHGYGNILVVNDGSRDRTAAEAERAGAKVVSHIVNRGLGAALGTGLACARAGNYKYAVTFDADGQHSACDVKRLLAPLKKNGADVVIGSRFLGSAGGMPPERKLMNRAANILTTVLFGVATTDSQSGLRAFNRRAIAAIQLRTDRMEVSSEFFREIKRNGLRFREVPITAVYTQESLRGSKQEKWASVKMPLRLLARMLS